MVDKERKQDLGSPEEEALEQHVREMMDVNVPDAAPESPAAVPAEKKTVSISITHDDEPSEKPAAKPKKATTKSEVAAAAEALNEQLASEVGTAPLLEAAPAKPKKITITHNDEQPEPAVELPDSIEDMQLDAEPQEPEMVDLEPIEPATDEAVPDDDAEAEESPLEDAIESPETEKAIAEIVASEGNELLAIQDKKVATPPKTKQNKSAKQKKHRLRAWFKNPVTRWLTILVVLGGGIAAGATPTARYYILNKAGVKSSASIVVIDQTTLRPLKNVDVRIADKTVKTDAEGRARVFQLPLGPTDVVVSKRAFATVNKHVVLGWGSNPLSDVSLKPEGDQHTFIITDVFSGKPIADVQAQAGDADALSNDKGELVLNIEPGDQQKVTVDIKADGYRAQQVTLDLSSKDKVQVALTPARKVAFVSKRSGTYDVYTIDADGKNEKLILRGTGKETKNVELITHPEDDIAVLVSTREGTRSSSGVLLETLTLLNLKDDTNKSVVSVPDIKIINWSGSRLIYVQLTTAASEDPARYKLMSYDYKSGDNRQLAAANYFNSVLLAGGKVVYAPASVYQNGVNVGVFTVQPDGSKKQAILNQEAWNLLRASYNDVTISIQEDWYQYGLGDNKPEKLTGQPSNTSSRLYSDSPDGKNSAWLDIRDGKGTIVIYDTAAKTEKTLLSQNGIKGPIRWLNNTTIIYRLVTSRESADYVLNLGSSTPKKITDVTDVAGAESWSF